MSLSVGTTCGIATQLLLDGHHPALNKPGVLAPYTKEICDPIRALLEKEGVNMIDAIVGEWVDDCENECFMNFGRGKFFFKMKKKQEKYV